MPKEFSPIHLEPIEITRFWDKLLQLGPDECWPWLRNRNKHGYGLFTSRQRSSYLAHRISYWLANGDFDWQLVIRHRCHNPSCCNPKHLRSGTHQDNTNDMIEAGRQGGQGSALRGVKGEAHPASKFSDEQKRQALAMYFSKPRMKQSDIAAAIGCGRHTVTRWCVEHYREHERQAQLTNPLKPRGG